MFRTPVSLLERLRQPASGDTWARFVELYTPLIYAWARRLVVPPDEPADLVQNVFVVLVHSLPAFTYDSRRSFRAWLWTVTRNEWQQGRRRRLLPAAGAVPADADELAGQDPALGLEEAEYRQYLVQRALQLMKADFQPATWKAFWELTAEGRPATAVAGELGLSVKAVYLAKARVLRRLRQELAGLLD